MREGLYRIYRVRNKDGEFAEHRMVARFLLRGDRLVVLEDHDGLLEDFVPKGVLSARALAKIQALGASPYWDLVSEDEVQGGERKDLLPEWKGE